MVALLLFSLFPLNFGKDLVKTIVFFLNIMYTKSTC